MVAGIRRCGRMAIRQRRERATASGQYRSGKVSTAQIHPASDLKPIYFAFIVGQIPELSEALEKVRDSQNQAKRDKNGRCRRKITSMAVTIPETSIDISTLDALDIDVSDINPCLL